MTSSMYMIESTDGVPPSLDDAAQKLGIAQSDLDRNFGVVMIDPIKRLYAVQVNENVSVSSDAVPYANPQIGTFGPPQ